MRLAHVCLFAKRSGGEDFQLATRGPAPTRAVELAAAQWLQAHLDSGNEKTLSLARLGGDWWLVRGVSEDATDAAGRRRCHLVLARLDEVPEERAVGALLLAAYQEGLPSWELPEPQEINAESAADGPAALDAALALAVGDPAYPVVADPALASDAVARVGLDAVDFASLMPLAVPARFPGTRGVVISRAPRERGDGAAFTDRLDLRGLARLAGSPARRAALVAAVRDGGAPADLTPAELAWLLSVPDRPALRAAALAQASRALVRELVKADRLEPGDLAAVAPRLDVALFARIAAGRAGADLASATRALLDVALAPPDEPPAGWLPGLRSALAEACGARSFWARWTQGMSPGLARWIAGELSDQAGGARAAALATSIAGAADDTARAAARHPGSALAPHSALPAADLVLVGPALGAAGTLFQLASWAVRYAPGRAEALAACFDAGTLREPLARWLRAALGRAGPTPPPPADLSAAELLLLLPLLHPARDALRVVLARDERGAGEDVLLPALCDALVRRDCVPLPAPDAAAATRRPDWVSAIAALPGWEHWT